MALKCSIILPKSNRKGDYLVGLFYILFFSFLTACQSPLKSYRSLSQKSAAPETSAEEESVSVKEPASFLKKKQPEKRVRDIPVMERPEVDIWIRYFTGRGRDQIKLYLERSQRYLDVMRSALKEENLPQNLVYMVLIESGFSSRARSRAQAVGYWQFMEATGRRYGLRINQFIDERRDPFLSTQAAGQYLKDLYNLFGSWYLAMASYNAGEYRVNRAMMKHYTRDFWKLKNKKSIPRETRHYVPKFMAAQLIAENPRKYGFDDLDYHEPIRFESVAVHKPVSLKKLAKSLSLKYEDLRLLNPKYVTQYVPLEKQGSAILRVPVGFAEKVTMNVVTASAMTRPNPKTYVYYKVRWGDSLYSLSRRHRTTVNTIARMNRMSPRGTLRAGRVIKLPPLYRSKKSLTTAQRKPAYHKVKKGESLGRLSKRYKIPTAQLKRWNKLSSVIIHPGQVLALRNPSAVSKKTHVVQKGETLISIAKKHKVQLLALMKNNSLTFKSILKVGQTIVIPE